MEDNNSQLCFCCESGQDVSGQRTLRRTLRFEWGVGHYIAHIECGILNRHACQPAIETMYSQLCFCGGAWQKQHLPDSEAISQCCKGRGRLMQREPVTNGHPDFALS